MADRRRPRDRSEFEIAVICALTIESDAVQALFDEFWEDDQSFGKAPGDPNAYTTGRVGNHNVVLAHMPGMGKGNAAGVAASFRSSFAGIKLGLVVGICGGVPIAKSEEIILGDIIISTGLVQHDFGRQYSDQVIRKDTLQDNLGRPNLEIRGFLNKLQGLRDQNRLRKKTSVYLAELCSKKGFEQSKYPGSEEDRLYESTYRHKHQDPAVCAVCAKSKNKDDPVCPAALEASCTELGCDERRQVQRARLDQVRSLSNPTDAAAAQQPAIHFGHIGSGDQVMKSGYHRDTIAEKEGFIGFEMEGAGVWEHFPAVVIKGVCDYADSHKNKRWQRYAAATAAACMKAFLSWWPVNEQGKKGQPDISARAPGHHSSPGGDGFQQGNSISGTSITGSGKGIVANTVNSGGGSINL
jgi:nucleoside phosphorylase